jgi:hypothetical protein
MRASFPPPPGCQLRDVLKEGGQESQAANSLERVQQITRHSQRLSAHNESKLVGNPGSAGGASTCKTGCSAPVHELTQSGCSAKKAEANSPTGGFA